MNRLGRLLMPVIMAGVLILSGCAAQKQLFKQVETIPSEKAVVYIYYSGDSKFPLSIKANGEHVISLKKGTYYPYLTEPGAIEFTASFMGTSPRVVDVQIGQTYYLKGGIPKAFSQPPSLVLVSEETGMREIANCTLMTSK
jgi:hypothetical protein